MTEENAKQNKIQITVEDGASAVVSVNGEKIAAISHAGEITAYKSARKLDAAAAQEAFAEGAVLVLSPDLRGVSMNGATALLTKEGTLAASTPSEDIIIKPSSVKCDLATARRTAKNRIQLTIEEGAPALVTVNGDKIAEISPEGDIVSYRKTGKIAADTALEAFLEGLKVTLTKDLQGVSIYGASVVLTPRGTLEASSPHDIKVMPVAPNDSPAPAPLVKDADGWTYAGESADGMSLYVAPEDSGVVTYQEAELVVAHLRKQGIEACIPTKGDMSVIFNSAAVEGLDRTLNHPKAWYWSSSTVEEIPGRHFRMRNSDSFIISDDENVASLRLVKKVNNPDNNPKP